MVELDPGVVELARRYLPGISRGAFDDPRTELIIGDGVRFVAEADRQFDVIIVDLTDPFGPGEVLFTEAFYADCRARLRPGGILVAQSGNPFMERARLNACLARLGGVFRDASFILTSVPAYLGGPFVFAWGCDDPGKRAPAGGATRRASDAGRAALLYASGARRGVRPSALADGAGRMTRRRGISRRA